MNVSLMDSSRHPSFYFLLILQKQKQILKEMNFWEVEIWWLLRTLIVYR